MSEQITEWLDESQQLAGQATAGPWFTSPFEHDPVWCDVVTGGVDEHEDDLPPWIEADNRKNAEFIAEARTRFPQAVAALRSVMGLHRRASDIHEPDDFCAECSSFHRTVEWPCPTLLVITDALGLEGDDDE